MRKWCIGCLFLFLVHLSACKKNQSDTVDIFYHQLNNYHTDSLQMLLAENFKINLNYSGYTYNRADFFIRYIRNYKVYQQKSTILKTIKESQPQQFLVEDNSDYLKYLKIKPPVWRVTIQSVNNKILDITIDTTENSGVYFREIKEKSNQFSAWMAEKHPTETMLFLHETEGLFLKRLKEYSDTEKEKR